jgi:hypothetical protein
MVLQKKIENWSLTSLQQRLAKTGGRFVKHARYNWLLLAEVPRGGTPTFPAIRWPKKFGRAQGDSLYTIRIREGQMEIPDQTGWLNV